ncbi:MAG: hypothetical protein ACI97A_003978 [Planctomycetota bacterium]|jgi:hypothetical protein
MSGPTTFRTFKRTIGQILRRLRVERPERRLVSDLNALVHQLRRAAELEPDVVVDAILYVIETLPPELMELDDRLGAIERGFHQVCTIAVDLMIDDVDDPVGLIDRFDVLERLFCAWVADDTGFLSTLDDVLLNSLTARDDEDTMIRICVDHLRHMPLVFPAPSGQKMEIDRTILQADRHLVERLLGEVLHVRGVPEYSILVAAAHHRCTNDPIDYIKFLMRAGLEQEASEVARRALRNPATVREARVRELYDSIIERQEGRQQRLDLARQTFLRIPSEETLESVLAFVSDEEQESEARSIIGQLEQDDCYLNLAFQLYLHEGLMLEADALVVTRPLDPYLLAQAADLLLDSDTLKAAGWLVVAAHHLMKKARIAQYRLAADWLGTVRTVSEAIGQSAAFQRTLEAFKDRYRRRTSLLRILDEAGL